jgi:hypothetical protein
MMESTWKYGIMEYWNHGDSPKKHFALYSILLLQVFRGFHYSIVP